MSSEKKWRDIKSSQVEGNHVMSCHVMSHVVSCRVVSCHVMSCHVMSYHVLSYHVMSCHVMSYHVMSCRDMWGEVKSCYVKRIEVKVCQVKWSEAKWSKEWCDLPDSLFQVSNWSLFSNLIFVSYPSIKDPKDFIPQQISFKKFHTPVGSLPPRYQSNLMTAPLSRVVQLMKLLPWVDRQSDCPSNFWDPEVEVTLSFPTVDGTLHLIFNDPGFNEKMWPGTYTNLKSTAFDHETKINNNKNVTQKLKKFEKWN